MDNNKRDFLIDRPVSGRAVSLESEADRRTAAVLLMTTLCLGVIRKRFPHLVDSPIAPPSLGERREIMDRLLRMTDSQTLMLAGRDQVIELAIQRGRD